MRWWEEEQARVKKDGGAVVHTEDGSNAQGARGKGKARGRGQEQRRVPPERTRGKAKPKADASEPDKKDESDGAKKGKKPSTPNKPAQTKKQTPPRPPPQARPESNGSATPLAGSRMNVAAPSFNPGAASFVPTFSTPGIRTNQR